MIHGQRESESAWAASRAVVPVPPLFMQREFERRVTEIEACKARHSARSGARHGAIRFSPAPRASAETCDMTHFAFLQPEWPAVSEAAEKAESLVHADPRASCFYARRALELGGRVALQARRRR